MFYVEFALRQKHRAIAGKQIFPLALLCVSRVRIFMSLVAFLHQVYLCDPGTCDFDFWPVTSSCDSLGMDVADIQTDREQVKDDLGDRAQKLFQDFLEK